MRIGVIGAGALGLYYGALLQRAGHDLHFLLRRDYEALTRRGLWVESVHGDFRLPEVAGYRQSTEIGPVELVLIGLKATANSVLVDLVRPLVGPGTWILTLQNGLGNEELLAEAFGAERVIGGTAFLCCNRGEPGTVRHLDQGAVRLAAFQAGETAQLEPLVALFNAAGIPCDLSEDLVRIRWEKLVWNIPFNGLCALTGLATDRLLAAVATRQQIIAMMHEVVAGANRQKLAKPIDADGYIDKLISVTEGMGGYRPSMMIDRLEGRPLELDAIYGVPLARAAAQGAAMPRVALLHALLQLTEVPNSA